MNILVIAHQLPYPPNSGGKIRHFHLYARLAERHQVTWVSPVLPANESHVEEVLKFCHRVIFLPDAGPVTLPSTGWRNLLMRAVAHLHWRRLFEFCFSYVNVPGMTWLHATSQALDVIDAVSLSDKFDVVICETIGSVELAPRTNQIPKLISLFDIQVELFRRLRSISPLTAEDRLFYLPELAKIWRYESRFYRGFDAAITVSQSNRSSFAKLCPKVPVYVVDNGVDIDYFEPESDREIDGRLVFVGHIGYPPNQDAAYFFCQEILPAIRSSLPHVTFHVVGRDAPADLARYPGVEVFAAVPDVRPYLQQASVVVVPLRAGSGTRIKILEAMAAKKAVVSTTVGAEGLDVEHGRHLMLADRPADFAQAVVDLMQDRSRRAVMGREARRLVEVRYSWQIQAERLDEIVCGLAGQYK